MKKLLYILFLLPFSALGQWTTYLAIPAGTSPVTYVADSTAFRAYTGTTAGVVILTDINRGGHFRPASLGATADQYMIFTDGLGNKWERFGYNKIELNWFGAQSDSTFRITSTGWTVNNEAIWKATSWANRTVKHILIKPGIYGVNLQKDSVVAVGSPYIARDLFFIENQTGFVLEFQAGAKLQAKAGIKAGSYLPNGTAVNDIVGNRALAGNYVHIKNSKNIQIYGGVLDGAKDGYIIGGGTYFGNRETHSNGIYADQSDHIDIHDMTIQRMGSDGISLGNEIELEGARYVAKRDQNFVISNCEIKWSGRGGISVVGGGLKCYSTYVHNIGTNQGGVFGQTPQFCVDIESDQVGDARNSTFEDCQIETSVGMAINLPWASGAYNTVFKNCIISNSHNYAIFAEAKGSKFLNCKITGGTLLQADGPPTGSAFNSPFEGPLMDGCFFSDKNYGSSSVDTAYHPASGTANPFISYQLTIDCRYATIRNCVFDLYKWQAINTSTGGGTVAYTDYTAYARLENNIFYTHSQWYANNYRLCNFLNVRMKNNKFYKTYSTSPNTVIMSGNVIDEGDNEVTGVAYGFESYELRPTYIARAGQKLVGIIEPNIYNSEDDIFVVARRGTDQALSAGEDFIPNNVLNSVSWGSLNTTTGEMTLLPGTYEVLVNIAAFDMTGANPQISYQIVNSTNTKYPATTGGVIHSPTSTTQSGSTFARGFVSLTSTGIVKIRATAATGTFSWPSNANYGLISIRKIGSTTSTTGL